MERKNIMHPAQPRFAWLGWVQNNILLLPYLLLLFGYGNFVKIIFFYIYFMLSYIVSLLVSGLYMVYAIWPLYTEDYLALHIKRASLLGTIQPLTILYCPDSIDLIISGLGIFLYCSTIYSLLFGLFYILQSIQLIFCYILPLQT